MQKIKQTKIHELKNTTNVPKVHELKKKNKHIKNIRARK